MDHIHVQLLLELKLLLLFFYVSLWYGVKWCFRLVSQSEEIRLLWTTTFFYGVACLPFIFLPIFQIIIGDCNFWPIHIHLGLMLVAFYLFVLIEEFRLHQRWQMDILIHHLVFGACFLLFSLNCQDGWVWGFTLIPGLQVSGVFYSLRVTLKKHHPAWYEALKPTLFTLNFWSFLLIRVIAQTVLVTYITLQLSSDHWLYYPFLSIFIFSFLMNAMWFKAMLKRYCATNTPSKINQAVSITVETKPRPNSPRPLRMG